jgi:hypothetical protein
MLCYLALAAFLLYGCGYSAGRKSPAFRPGVASVAIPIFENTSSEPLIETALTEAIREKFINDGRLRVVPEKEADLVLRGTIKGYGIRTLAFDASDRATESRVIVDVGVDVIDRRGGRKTVSFDLQARSEFTVSEVLSQMEKAKEAAEMRAFRELADRLTELLFWGVN